MFRFILLFIAVFPLISIAAETNDASKPAPKSKWTADDVLQTEWSGNFRTAPDCRKVVWVKAVPDKEKNSHVGNLMLSDLTGTNEIQLTRGTEGSGDPKWSPDGQLIGFVSSRPDPSAKADDSDSKGKDRIWLINPFGGEAWPLTDGKRDVKRFEWANATTIVYSAQETPSLREQLDKEKKETSQVVEDDEHEPPVRLFQIDVKSKKVKRLTENINRIGNFSLSPDGTHVVTIHERTLRNAWDRLLKPLAYLIDLRSGEQKPIFDDPKYNVWHVRWQWDSQGFYVASGRTSNTNFAYPAVIDLYHYDLARDSISKVQLDWDKGLHSANLLGLTEDGFITLLADGVRPRLARYRLTDDTWKREWIGGIHVTNLFDFDLGKDGKTLVYLYSTAFHPDQRYRATLNETNIESAVPLTKLNSQFEGKPFAWCEIVRWKGALDETVEGLLYYPHDYEAGKRYALVVGIHGGPAAAFFDTWNEFWVCPCNLLATRGAFVFLPNYHGSSNYGLEWTESNLGRMNDLEVEDIEKGVDHLIEQGLADPEKLAAMGWSQGGVLAAALTVATPRYKAAIAGAGVVDWIGYWAKSDIGASFTSRYIGKNPLQDPMLYVKGSSFYQMERVTTPTLIIFGNEDHRVPVEQGWKHYRALQQAGKADVKFVLLPGEKHGPGKLVHVRRTLEEQLAWLDKYLFKDAKEDTEGLKPDAPLSIALKLQKAKGDGARYGIVKNGKLIPETVTYRDLEIGRFEVTCAQFAAFDTSYTLESGEDNLPASGISFERAKAYCAWLSELMAEDYRLPTHEETESIYAESSGAQNTLDYWAGGTVNLDDAIKLLAKVRQLGSKTSLLRTVGSFKPSGSDNPVFDLGGNVAEWTVDADGTGHVSGGSADMPADITIRKRQPAPEYVGFRVIKGKPAGLTAK
jgi:dipeptidyl aminopeptidase/acylaminoacyl peptidase